MISGKVGRGVEYIYYTPEEADEIGIDYSLEWRKARERDVGKWILSDTGMVVGPLIHVRGGREHKTSLPYSIVRIPTGTFYGQPGVMLSHEERENRFSFGGKNARKAHKDPNRPLSTKERRFVRFLMRYLMEYAKLKPGDEMEAAERAYLAVSKRVDVETSKSWRREARRFARRANVENAIDTHLGDLLTRKGVSDEYIVDEMKKLVDKEGGSDHVRHAVLKDFARMRGIANEETGIPVGRLVFPGYNPEQIAAGEDANSKRQRALPPPEDGAAG